MPTNRKMIAVEDFDSDYFEFVDGKMTLKNLDWSKITMGRPTLWGLDIIAQSPVSPNIVAWLNTGMFSTMPANGEQSLIHISSDTIKTYSRAAYLSAGQSYYSEFDNYFPYNQIGRCVVDKDTAVVKYWLNQTDSTKKMDGSASILTGEDGDVMVHIPAFYFKQTHMPENTIESISISTIKPDLPALSNCPDGYEIEPFFINPDGTIAPYRLIGAYLATNINNQMRSVSYEGNAAGGWVQLSTESPILPSNHSNLSMARSGKRTNRWSTYSFYANNCIYKLYLSEFGNFNAHEMIRNNQTYMNMETVPPYRVNFGATNSIGNKSGTTGPVTIGTTQTLLWSYRGIEGWVDAAFLSINVSVLNFVTCPYEGYYNQVPCGGVHISGIKFVTNQYFSSGSYDSYHDIYHTNNYNLYGLPEISTAGMESTNVHWMTKPPTIINNRIFPHGIGASFDKNNIPRIISSYEFDDHTKSFGWIYGNFQEASGATSPVPPTPSNLKIISQSKWNIGASTNTFTEKLNGINGLSGLRYSKLTVSSLTANAFNRLICH